MASSRLSDTLAFEGAAHLNQWAMNLHPDSGLTHGYDLELDRRVVAMQLQYGAETLDPPYEQVNMSAGA